MKKNKVLTTITVLSIIALSCFGVSSKKSLNIVSDFKCVFQTPDSLLTSEQLKTKESLLQLIKIHVKVKDNHFVNSATPNDFKNRGVPVEYYYLLEKNIKEVNSYVDSTGFKNLDELYRKGELKL